MDTTSSCVRNGVNSVKRSAIVADFGNLRDAPASFGTGSLEILEVTKILENASIPCCVLGISALKYYGAGRLRHVSFFVLRQVSFLTC
jgi:hypothetical protein